MTTPDPDSPAGFVSYVKERITEPGARSDLRSGLGKPVELSPRMHRVIAWKVHARAGSAMERAHYGVAALIASRTRQARDREPATESGGRSLGQALAAAVNHSGLRDNTAEGRLHLLVRQNLDGVHRQLIAVIRLLDARGQEPDWVSLLWDLARWESDRDRIAQRWLQDYYRTLRRASDTTSPSPSPDTSNES
ncbi:type I-E CRISPR-associated protein Cse2/CasB [Longispora sp. NPDC051575]|uniref:type I-E CRISPR-associated protein Cse2/CasB n=1 Tax=Longispora sp. NPDC051575 TaxID=3154943 RepID=UPI0034266D23